MLLHKFGAVAELSLILDEERAQEEGQLQGRQSSFAHRVSVTSLLQTSQVPYIEPAAICRSEHDERGQSDQGAGDDDFEVSKAGVCAVQTSEAWVSACASNLHGTGRGQHIFPICQESEHLDELQKVGGTSTSAKLPADSGVLLPPSLQAEKRRRRRQSQPLRPLLVPLTR